MRVLTLLATTVLLAACLHDAEDHQLFVAESGASLTYYLGYESKSEEDNPWDSFEAVFPEGSYHGTKNGDDDPWDTINNNFGVGSRHTGRVKSGDDPWDSINDKYGEGTRHTGKGKSVDGTPDDPWNSIQANYGEGTRHTGKGKSVDGTPDDDPWSKIFENYGVGTKSTSKLRLDSARTDVRRFMGWEKSTAVFVSFTFREPTSDRARVVEVRGNVLRLEFADGAEQFVVNAPASWTEGTELETRFLAATTKKDRPFLGVRLWRTAGRSNWGRVAGAAGPVEVSAWPREYYLQEASLLATVTSTRKTNDDPWDSIMENYAPESRHSKSGDDDPWDTILQSFGVESRHTGKVKNDRDVPDDPWDTISESFPIESMHTGKSHDDPWDTITDKFGEGSVHPGKSHDDPWDTIRENFDVESTHTGKSHDDPWDTINNKFGPESVHGGKKGASFRGVTRSKVLFVSVRGPGKGGDDPWDTIGENFPIEGRGVVTLRLVEVREGIGRFEAETGVEVFGVGMPAAWRPGLVLKGAAYLLAGDDNLPLKGAMVWGVDRNLSVTPKTR